MLVFAICLGCAGAVLSMFARLPVLVAVVFLMVLALVLSTALRWLGVVEMSASLPWTIVVAIVALQIGYGLGVVVRAGVRPFSSDLRHRGSVSTADADKPSDRGTVNR